MARATPRVFSESFYEIHVQLGTARCACIWRDVEGRFGSYQAHMYHSPRADRMPQLGPLCASACSRASMQHSNSRLGPPKSVHAISTPPGRSTVVHLAAQVQPAPGLRRGLTPSHWSGLMLR